jgi:hypothetical protein
MERLVTVSARVGNPVALGAHFAEQSPKNKWPSIQRAIGATEYFCVWNLSEARRQFAFFLQWPRALIGS